MSQRCGQCRQFTRQKGSVDLCDAWGQPTNAKRNACEYFMPTIRAKDRVISPRNANMP
ncbi:MULTISPECIES: hypothetical protein [Vibrio]|jgi:hypothetical protein|uniref:hypothetical protein n=1 Tax=Vibrio TaxID=662 RepID=UPI000C3868C3|nr:hypothetical protein [Vibrio rotiferianus]PIB11550.1 hypothetical protein B853_23860 [Vibrio rotiferianus CAIM 577 = LMG 21460]